MSRWGAASCVRIVSMLLKTLWSIQRPKKPVARSAAQKFPWKRNNVQIKRIKMDNFLKDLGRSYIMSSFMPVAVFMVFIGLVFKDFIPLSVFKIINSFEQSWLILVTLSILFTTWGGWILYSSWSVIEGFFKGKYLPSFIKTKWTNYFQKQSKDKIGRASCRERV